MSGRGEISGGKSAMMRYDTVQVQKQKTRYGREGGGGGAPRPVTEIRGGMMVQVAGGTPRQRKKDVVGRKGVRQSGKQPSVLPAEEDRVEPGQAHKNESKKKG